MREQVVKRSPGLPRQLLRLHVPLVYYGHSSTDLTSFCENEVMLFMENT